MINFYLQHVIEFYNKIQFSLILKIYYEQNIKPYF